MESIALLLVVDDPSGQRLMPNGRHSCKPGTLEGHTFAALLRWHLLAVYYQYRPFS